MAKYAKELKRFISLGAGVQSSTMALMFADRIIGPMPDGAIFADTQCEPESVYRWLDWLETQLPFPVYRVTAGNLEADTLKLRTSRKTGNKYIRTLVPAFFENPKSKHGRGIFGRKCTAEYKIRVITKKQKELAKVPRAKKGSTRPISVIAYVGISWDEIERMKPSTEEWCEVQWPLIDLRMTRDDCKAWMKLRGYPEPPRSACYFCPFHSDAEWARLKYEEPKAFERAVRFDKELRRLGAMQTGTAASPGELYLHQSLQPLDEVDFGDTPSARDHFANECAGMCGV